MINNKLKVKVTVDHDTDEVTLILSKGGDSIASTQNNSYKMSRYQAQQLATLIEKACSPNTQMEKEL
jgi:hypothetical protein